MSKTFSIVIPTFNHYDLLHRALFDIYQKCSPVLEVIVVDDCSTDISYAEGLDWWKDNGMLHIRHVRMSENVGFLRASNVGLRKAEGDIVALLSNDVLIFKDIVKLATNHFLRMQGEPSLLGGVVYESSTGWNEFDGNIFPYVEGWLLITENEMWQDLGYLDSRYVPNDFEDVDLSTAALSKGYKLFSLEPDSVRHMGAQSIGYTEQRSELTTSNRQKFKEKWLTK